MSKSCCFTGHRDLPAPDSPEYAHLLSALEQAIDDVIADGCTDFYAGAAIGFDMLAGEAIARRMESNPALTLTLCVPFIGHDFAFSPQDKARWAVLKERATEAHYLSEHYLPFMYALRNEYLVNHADVCIAYVRNRKSGSGQTLKMAEKKGLTILPL